MPILTANVTFDEVDYSLRLDTAQDLHTQIEAQAATTLRASGKKIRPLSRRHIVSQLALEVRGDFEHLRSVGEEKAQARLTGASGSQRSPIPSLSRSPSTKTPHGPVKPPPGPPPSVDVDAALLPSVEPTLRLKVGSGTPMDRTRLQFNGKMNTLELRGGTHSPATRSGVRCNPYFGGDWSARLSDPTQAQGHLACRVAEDIVEGPLVQSGTIKPELVPWENGEGFTLLVDVCHAAQADGSHPFEVGTEWVRLELSLGGRRILAKFPRRDQPHSDKWGCGDGNKPGLDCLVPEGFRTQVAIPFSKAALLRPFPDLTDADVISITPRFGNKDATTFHSNSPHTVRLPKGMFKKGGALKRMEWGEVPTNGYGALDGIHTPFLDMGLAADLRPKVITSMETEAEFTLAGDPVRTERTLLEMLQTIDSMAQTGTGGDATAQARLEKFLGTELCDGCEWHVERKASRYEVVGADGMEITAPRGFDVSPPRPELQRRGLGRPGILYDTYLHIGPDGVVRQRDNFAKEGIVSVKGGHKRRGPFMVRYNRQVECNRELPVEGSHLSKRGDLEALLYSEKANFQDCLFQYPDSGSLPDSWVPDEGPRLQPQLQVKSERYRYLFVRKQRGGSDNRPVMIELSFDLSTGQALDASGRPTGSPVRTVGFEFGLDHLGASADAEVSGDSLSKTSLSTASASGSVGSDPSKKSMPKTVLDPVSHRTWHDRLDLDHPTLFTRPAFTIFEELVATVTPKLCSGIPIEVAGEKAATMMSHLSGGKSRKGGGESAATLFKTKSSLSKSAAAFKVSTVKERSDAAAVLTQLATPRSWNNTGGDIAPFLMASTIGIPLRIINQGPNGNQTVTIDRDLSGAPLSGDPITVVNIGSHYWLKDGDDLIPVAADGDCFYHAIARALGSDAATLRNEVFQHALLSNDDGHLQPLIDTWDLRLLQMAEPEIVEDADSNIAVQTLLRDLTEVFEHAAQVHQRGDSVPGEVEGALAWLLMQARHNKLSLPHPLEEAYGLLSSSTLQAYGLR